MDAYTHLIEDYEQGNLKYVDLKNETAKALIEHNTPLIERKEELKADRRAVKDMIKASSAEIRKVAQETIKEVKELTGLVNVRF